MILVPKVPAVFDVANSLDFEGANVKFMTLQNMIADYEIEYDEAEGFQTISKILHMFLKDHQNCHIFIDEIPVPFNPTDEYNLFWEHPEAKRDPNYFLWMTFRLCEQHETVYEKYIDSVARIKESLSKTGFEIPKFGINMRNSANVQSSFSSIYAFGKIKERVKDMTRAKNEKVKITASMTSLPHNTVPGKVTQVIPIDNSKVCM